MKRALVLLSLIFTIAGTNALAQDARPMDVTEYKFHDDLVQGDLVAPDGAISVIRRPGKERSLIKLRSHFVMEMLKNVEDI